MRSSSTLLKIGLFLSISIEFNQKVKGQVIEDPCNLITCESDQVCDSELGECIQNPCTSIRCLPDFECNPFNGECVGVTCDTAFAPCDVGFQCVERNINCFVPPCPQFECEEVFSDPCIAITCGPDFQCDSDLGTCVAISGCETDCGEVVGDLTLFSGDGVNYCKTCICLFYGKSFCFPFGSCASDPIAESCDEDEEEDFCTTTCGNVIEIGESFRDDGSNFCNGCSCQEGGRVICTELACDLSSSEASCEE